MTAQRSLLPPTATAERAGETDTAERCDDPTPRGVIRAALAPPIERLMGAMFVARVMAWLLFDPKPEPLRVLDVGAGYGAWSSELRRHANRQGWPVHITGVEILEARRKHLEKWCDRVGIGEWQDGLHLGPPGGGRIKLEFDLVIGNPPFDELTGPKGGKRPPELCMPAALLEVAPAVLLLHTQQAFLKSEAGRASWRHNPPAASWLVPGGVGFRGPGQGADSRCYQVTLWLRDHTGPCSVYMLPDLPPSARAWTVPPGTEQPSVCQTCGPHCDAVTVDEAGVEVCDCKACGGTNLDPHGDLPAAPGYAP